MSVAKAAIKHLKSVVGFATLLLLSEEKLLIFEDVGDRVNQSLIVKVSQKLLLPVLVIDIDKRINALAFNRLVIVS